MSRAGAAEGGAGGSANTAAAGAAPSTFSAAGCPACRRNQGTNKAQTGCGGASRPSRDRSRHFSGAWPTRRSGAKPSARPHLNLLEISARSRNISTWPGKSWPSRRRLPLPQIVAGHIGRSAADIRRSARVGRSLRRGDRRRIDRSGRGRLSVSNGANAAGIVVPAGDAASGRLGASWPSGHLAAVQSAGNSGGSITNSIAAMRALGSINWRVHGTAKRGRGRITP